MKDFGKNLLRILILLIWDLISATVAVFAGIEIVYEMGPDHPFGEVFNYALLYLIPLIIFHALFSIYSTRNRQFGTLDFFRHGVISACIGVVCYLFPRLFDIKSLQTIDWRATIVIVVVLYLFSCLGHGANRIYRSVAKYYYYRIGGGHKKVNTIIFGAGELGSYLAKRLLVDESENMPIGFIDDNSYLVGSTVAGLRVLGTRHRLAEVIVDKSVGEVIVAINDISKEILREVIAVCAESGCKVRRFGSVSDLTSPTGRRLDMADIDTNDLIRREKVELDMETVCNFITGKTVLVTGGAGSIGSEICNQVLKFGAKKLVVFDIHENGLFKIDNILKATYETDRYDTVLGSVRDEDRLNLVFEQYKPDVVFHAAAHKHVPMMELNPCEAIKNNVFGTWNTAKIAAKHEVSKFILISTDKAVNPTNIMGASKRIAEMIIQMEDKIGKTQFAAVRFGNVLGSEGSVIPIFLDQIKKGGPVKVTHPEMKRYFMTIPEAVQLVLEAGALANGGEIFVLDMGEPILISDLAADLIRLSGQVPNKDIDIIYTGLRPGEKLFEELSLSDEEVTRTQNDKIYVCKPIPTDVDLILEQTKKLKKYSVKDDSHSVFAAVKELVPTFDHK